MSALSPGGRCEWIAARQHGVIARPQALAAGLKPGAVTRRVASGRWERIHRSVYRSRAAPASWLSSLMAAVMWAAPHGLVSHRAAARLYELEGVGDAPIEIWARTGRSIPGAVIHRLRPEDRPKSRMIEGFPVTSLERTLLDLAAAVPIERAGLALDDALRRGLTTVRKLRRRLDAEGRCGRDGTAAMRRLLAVRTEADETMQSALEARLIRALRRAGLPPPALQHEVRAGGRLVARLDAAYPELRLGIDVHGYRWHSGRQRWQRDLRRENRLKRAGWTVLVYTWDDVAADGARVVEEVGAEITERAAG